MAANPLSSGPVLGVLSASGSSPTFTTTAGQSAIIIVGLSRLASAITPQIMRSTDGGTTWTSTSTLQPYTPGFFFGTVLDTTAATYRVDASFSSGSAFFCARGSQLTRKLLPEQLIEPGDASGSKLSMTTAQMLNWWTVMLTPLTTAQIAAPLTLYKQCAGGVIAKLSVPSDALTGFDYLGNTVCYGLNRSIRASKVQVQSLTDASGNAVNSAQSKNDPGTTYNVGATVEARDLSTLGFIPNIGTFSPSSGIFDSATYVIGIYGFSTLIEAVCASNNPVSLAAFGF